MTDPAAPGPGHNITPFDEISVRTDELVKNANLWLKERKEIGDEETAGRASDFLTQLRAEGRAAEAERKREKQPHIDAGKAVDAKYQKIGALLTKSADAIKALLTPYLQRKQREEEEERQRQQEEERRRAEAEQKRADDLAKEGKTIEAEVAQEEAEETAKKAEKLGTTPVRAAARGSMGRAASLRTVYYGEITDIDKCLAKYKDHPRVLEALQIAVNADIRGGNHDIPGVRVRQKQTAT